MFCENCGKQVVEGSLFCDGCGSRLNAVVSEPDVQGVPVENTAETITLQLEPEVVQPEVQPAVQPTPQPAPVVQQTPVQQSAPVQALTVATQTEQAKPQKPEKTKDLNKPISVLGYIGTYIVLGIPILNIILLFVWAFGSNVNKNRKNLSIAILILSLISMIATIVLTITMGAVIVEFLEDLAYSLPF